MFYVYNIVCLWLLDKSVARSPACCCRGTPEPWRASMLLQRAPPATPHVAIGCCQGHRGVTPISFLFTVVLTVFGLCDILEYNSVVWLHIYVCVGQFGMFVVFVFNVVIVNLVVARSCCLY